MHKKIDCDVEVFEDYVRVEHLTLRHSHHIRFVEDCLAAGFAPTAYEGRFCYIGPAVILDDLTDMVRLHTDVPLSWDDLGKGYIVHPSKSANESDLDRIAAMQFLHKIRKEAGIIPTGGHDGHVG